MSFAAAGIAADKIWNNTGTDFNAASSWTGGTPGTADRALFDTAKTSDPNLSSSATIQGISFAGGTGYVLTGGSGTTLSLSSATIVSNSSSAIYATGGANTIAADLNFTSGTSASVTVNGGASVIVSGNISTNAKLTLQESTGGGSLTLSGDNSQMTGGFDHGDSAGLQLNLGSATALGTGTFTWGSTGNFAKLDNTSGGSLTLTTNNAITLNGNSGHGVAFVGTNDLNVGTGDVTLNNFRAINVSASTLTFGGNVGQSALGFGITKQGAGTLVLGGSANSYTGNTTLSAGNLVVLGSSATSNTSLSTGAGILRIGNAGSLGTGSLTWNGGTIEAVGGSVSTTNAVTLGGSIATGGAHNLGFGAVTMTGNRTITVNNPLTTFASLAPDATPTRTLTKAGSGILEITGSASYTGSTTVNAGTLLIGSTGSIGATSSITVNPGGRFVYNNNSTALDRTVNLAGNGSGNRATLGGSGTISSAITLNNIGDTLSPGNSPGNLTLTSAQSWSSFTYDWETNNFAGNSAGIDFDQIEITGGNLTLSLAGLYGLNVISLTGLDLGGNVANFSETDRSWNILTTSGTISNFVSANWTIDTSAFTSAPNWQGDWTLSLNGSQNALVLNYTAVPEPASFVLFALGLMGFVARRRR